MPTYLLTWTTSGTWLHGDERGSVTMATNRVGTPRDGGDPDRSDRARRVLALRVSMPPPDYRVGGGAHGITTRQSGW